jgi:hypothetical protein
MPRRRGLREPTVSAATARRHQRDGLGIDSFGSVGKFGDLHGHGHQHHKHQRELERERCAGRDSTVGTIASNGVYTAPADLPSPAVVQVTATSQADSTKSDSASETITSDISLALTPNPVSVELGATQGFHSTITSAGHPDTTIRWSVNGASCPAACGTVDASGNYTAPQILPSPASVTLTAQSAADPSKQVSAAIMITSTFTLTLTAPASVSVSETATLVATLTPVPGSNPSAVLTWTLSGAGCSGSSCAG